MLHITPGLTAYIMIITALLGLVMGSFLNCWAYRLAQGTSVAKGRSHCPACGHVLGALDLIPVLSYVLLGGKCRYCHTKLSSRYVVAELLCATYYLSVVWHFDVSLDAAKYLILGSLLFCAGLVDLETMTLPDRLIVGILLNFAAFTAIEGGDILAALLGGVLSALTVSVPLLVLILIMDKVLGRESMGGGDVKLLFAIGLYFSWMSNILLLIIACILGIAIGILARNKNQDPDNPGAFPFGPALIAAYWIVLWGGQEILHRYLSLF